MAQEYEYGLRYTAGGKETLPALDEYIQGGIHSLGFPFWGTSVLILLNEPDLLVNLNLINDIIVNTGATIRLYNDIRTYEKEVQEDNINAITIVQASLQPSASSDGFKQAQGIVHKLAEEYARKSNQLAGELHTESGKFEQMIRRIVAFHAYFYGSRSHTHDYHTISSSDSFSMIQGE
jgi:hypothetical protein